MNIKLDINKDIIDRLKEDLIPSQLIGSVMLIIMALYYDNYNFLNYLDDNNKEKQVLLLYLLLLRKGYIEQTNEDELEEALYKLTQKGQNIAYIAQVSSLTINAKEEDKIENWVQEYNNLFPENERGQRNLRGDLRSCEQRMVWFQKNYKYSKEHILAATEEYINSQAASNDGHKYTITSDYFIKKGTGTECTSRLAQACEAYDPNTLTPKQDYLRDTI